MRWIISDGRSAVTKGPRKGSDRWTLRVGGGADESAGSGGTSVAEAGLWWIVQRWYRIDGDGLRSDSGAAVVVGHRECYGEHAARRDAVGVGRLIACRCATVPEGPGIAHDRPRRHVGAGADEVADQQRTGVGEPGARRIHRSGGGDCDGLSLGVAGA